jgi:hypothetical protein
LDYPTLDDEGTTILQEIKTTHPVDMASHPRSPEPSTTSLWEPQIYLCLVYKT